MRSVVCFGCRRIPWQDWQVESRLITGGARGIGRATAELFATEGARVIATDVGDPSPPFAHPNILFTHLDVASEIEWRTVVAGIIASHGSVDILVNNAGIGGSQAVIDRESLADWNRVVAVNQTGSSSECGR